MQKRYAFVKPQLLLRNILKGTAVIVVLALQVMLVKELTIEKKMNGIKTREFARL